MVIIYYNAMNDFLWYKYVCENQKAVRSNLMLIINQMRVFAYFNINITLWILVNVWLVYINICFNNIIVFDHFVIIIILVCN